MEISRELILLATLNLVGLMLVFAIAMLEIIIIGTLPEVCNSIDWGYQILINESYILSRVAVLIFIIVDGFYIYEMFEDIQDERRNTL